MHGVALAAGGPCLRAPHRPCTHRRPTDSAYERCTTLACARAIARKAESIVRAATMGPVEGASEHVSGHTVMARLCPSTGGRRRIRAGAERCHRGARCEHTLQVATGPRREPRGDAVPGARRAGADRWGALRPARSAVGHPARRRLIGSAARDQTGAGVFRRGSGHAQRMRAGRNGCAQDAEDSGTTQRLSRLRSLCLTRTPAKGALAGTHDPVLYLSADPDRAVENTGKCVWTSRRRWLSSSTSAQSTGNAMACTGTPM